MTLFGPAGAHAAALDLQISALLQPLPPGALDELLGSCAAGEATTRVLRVRSFERESCYVSVTATKLPTGPAGGALLLELVDVSDTQPRMIANELYARAVDALPDSLMITDAEGTIRYVNTGFVAVSGYTRSQCVGKLAGLLKSGRHRPDHYARLWATISSGAVYRGELINRHRTGELYHEDVIIAPLCDEAGAITHYVSLGRDITLQKQVEARTEDKAFFDPLTGAANHRLLRERSRLILALARRQGNMAALLHVDIDRLRPVNQTYGRAVGDKVLQIVAERLRQSLRESDTLARLASDEFLVMLSEVIDADATARVVRRIGELISKPYEVDGHSIILGAHIGVALYPQDANTFDALAESAEHALGRAREAGHIFDFFHSEQSVLSHNHLLLDDELRYAWDRELFELHYQPILAAATGRVVGAEALARGQIVGIEALARWPHLQRGMIMPAQFIPIAEQTGRIVSIDRWAIATSARQAAAWGNGGWGGWISVNLSARSLHDIELRDFIDRTMAANKLPAERLVVEITETSAMRDPDTTARVLRQLKEIGVMVALDDFGIGHSSLAYLKRFPVDLLKLDASFIRDIGVDSRDEQLIMAMISLAHRIGAQVVAEGVEDLAQLEWLKAAGCDFIQGYLVGRPAPPQDVRTSGEMVIQRSQLAL